MGSFGMTEQKRARHFADFCQMMPEQIARLSWSRRQIDAYRTQALRKLIGHAKEHSSWHRQRLQHIGTDTISPGDLSQLPTMTKTDLMDHWDEIVTVPGANLAEAETKLRAMDDQFYLWGDHALFSSGGTGGRPGIFLYDWEGLALNWAGMARSIRRYVASLPMPGSTPRLLRTATMAAEVSAHGSYVVGRVFSNPENPTYRFSGWRSIEGLLPQLNAAMPEIFCCYPSLMPALIAAVRSGELKMRPEMIVCGGEHFPDEVRRQAVQTWPEADVLAWWATSEAGGTFPCPMGEGFHISEDQIIIEPVDEDGEPVQPGQRSTGIYLTNLYNLAQPIIRYYIDDVFEFDDRPCPCGSHFRKVRQVHGRSFERFRYGNITVHPLTLQLAVLEQPNILEYQIAQTPAGAHLRYRCKGPVDAARLQTKMLEGLRSYGIADPEISLEPVDALGRTAAGKLRRFIPLSDSRSAPAQTARPD